MARLPALIKAIANNDDRPATMISHFARVLRNEGLIISNVAGLGAPAMTYKDAAVLLMATLGSSTPAGAAEAVANLGQLTAWGDNVIRGRSGGLLASVVGSTFTDALTFMIEHADEIADWEINYRAHRDAPRDLTSAAAHEEAALGKPLSLRPIAISVYSEGYAAEIRLGLLQSHGEMPFREFYRPGPKSRVLVAAETRENVGIRLTGARTLYALKRAVDEAPPARTWKRKKPAN